MVLVLANGLFAGAEIAVLTVRAGRITEREDVGDPRAAALRTLRDSPERFLATVQIGITVISAAAAAFGGSRISASLAPILAPLFGAYAASIAFGVVVVGISFLSLVLGELIPKSLALRYSEHYAFRIARPMLRLSHLARPMVWFLTSCSNVVLRLFGDRTSFTETRLSREELRELVTEASKTGSIDPHSSEMVTRALTFGEVQIGEVMVPRPGVVAISRTTSQDELRRIVLEQGHSRMPVYGRELDDVIGYVVTRDILALVWAGGLVVLDDIVRPAFVVEETAKIAETLRDMQARRVQLAIVLDENGSMAGIATIEDLVEELIGEVAAADDAREEVVHIEADGSALVPGWAPLRKVNRILGVALPIARDSRTIAGLCMALALIVPPVGTRVTATDGTIIEVLDASPRRVRLVRIRKAT
ncbi:MAG: HlyC/CorC family transporter [Deltaproteobacteria bacterium]|nr:HlyC/CorC family transporter [Deltaproteobacteria bacterium]